MDKTPDEILKRLEELRCWQQMQQQKLHLKQLSRSELCSMEQQKLCEMFGLSLTSTVSNLSMSDFTDQRPLTPTKSAVAKQNTSVPEFETNDQSDMDASNVPGTPQKHFRVETPINNFSLEELESYGKDNQVNPDIDDKPKKSYLKRGQGLANRFKIHPEKLRIENLPKYKFANSHKKSKFFRDNKPHCEAKRTEKLPEAKQFAGDLKQTNKVPVKGKMIAAPKQQNKFIDDGHLVVLKSDYGEFGSC